ncbi:MAG: GDSL-type esterase/lipase family protein [Eubacteriales bacterium]|nr:GDSL-type esterase/lipase family protein [Eubacteriales bacterium]
MTHILCIGDSITDCGRLFGHPPYGNGYVAMLHDRLTSMGADFRITNCGVDGFTVARLLENARSRYLPLQADIITILIGINDIGLMMSTNRTPRQKDDMMKAFLQNYERLLQKLSAPKRRIILMEPFLFPYPAEYRTWFPHLHTMSQGIAALAENYHLPYILLHDRLNEEARKYGLDFLTVDGIHLTSQGHRILAEELLHVLRKFLM